MWASEVFDPLAVGSGVASGLVGGRTSSPRAIFEELSADCEQEEQHSDHIKRYRRKFRSLAKTWRAANEINDLQYAEILSLLGRGWNIFKPLLYVIPRAPIENAGRLRLVEPGRRATLGPKYQIKDLMPDEFDILRWVPR